MADTLREKIISYGLHWDLWLLWGYQNNKKLWSTFSIFKQWHYRKFLLQKENRCNV